MSGYRFVAPALLLVLGGCAAGPDYERPELEVPEKYIQPVQQGESFANTPWWELFEDPQLQELIRIALEENQDLGIAAARVEEFRAVLGVTRADQFPTVDITASGAQTEGSDNVFPGSVPGFGNDKVENYRLSADVFWELDLFGRLRRSTEAARAQLLATEEAQRSITISLVASVASSYMLLRDLDAQLEIARRTESTRTDSLGIIQARFDKGTVPKLDVNQAEIELAVASAAVAAAERAVTQTENALAVLLGRNPGAIPRGLALEQQTLPPGIPSGLPSELLQRRPDVLASEAELAAQTARIGIAQAARWPSLSLTGALGFESDDLSTLTDSGSDFWSAGLGIVQPLFNAGRNRSRVNGAASIQHHDARPYDAEPPRPDGPRAAVPSHHARRDAGDRGRLVPRLSERDRAGARAARGEDDRQGLLEGPLPAGRRRGRSAGAITARG